MRGVRALDVSAVFQVACCFGSAACSLCCACCPSAKSSTTTRIAYASVVLVGTIVALIMLAPGLEDTLDKVRDAWGVRACVRGVRASNWFVTIAGLRQTFL